MQNRTPKLLEDIRAAAEFIRAATAGITVEQYLGDEMVRSAVEHKFEIIGEAVRRISHIDVDTAERIGETDRVIAFRNVLSHGYDVIDDAVVWRVAREQVPQLLEPVAEILESRGGSR